MKTASNGYMFKRGKNGKKVKDKEPGIYYLQYTVNGCKKFMSLKTGNKVKAEKLREEYLKPTLLSDTKEKIIEHIAEARKIITDIKYPLNTVWEKYYKSSNRPQSSAGTLGNYERNWKLFLEWLKAEHPRLERINQITNIEAEQYAVFLWDKNIAANTFNYHIQSLKLIYKTLIDSLQTPFSKIQRKKGIQINRKDFTPEQINLIFSVIDKDDFEIMNKSEMRLLCYIGAFTGLRLVDAVLLKCDQIDIKKNTISCTPVKTQGILREVHIPIHPELQKQLATVDMKEPYAMPNIAKRYQHNPDGIKNDFLKILDAAGLTDIKERERGLTRRLYGFHSFRHGFASIAANAGIPITTLAALLGDNIRTLEKYYVKINDKSKLAAIDSLPAITQINNTQGAIDIRPTQEPESITERVKSAIKLIKTARMNKDLKEQLLNVLQG